jgi:hypothetical protein
MWTAPVTVKGAIAPHGSQKYERFQNIGPNLQLEIVNTDYDNTRHEMSLTVQLRNMSNTQIDGPILLRLLSVFSKQSAVSVVGADNRSTGDGAAWEFLSLNPDGSKPSLKPNATSVTKTLRFRFSKALDIVPDNPFGYPPLINFDLQILGEVPVSKRQSQSGA